MLQMVVRMVLTSVFGPEVTHRIERAVEAALGIFVVGLFLVLGIVFGDLRVVAIMLAVSAAIGLYAFRERLHISKTVVRVMLLALIVALFAWMRSIVQASPASGS